MERVIIQVLFCFVFLLENSFGKNHFDTKVLNNRFKVRRLITFKLDLCRVIYELGLQNSDAIENDDSNTFFR